MGYTKLNDLEGVVGGEEIKKGSSEKVSLIKSDFIN